MTPQATPEPGTRLCTQAWLLRGISSIRGELQLRAGEVSFRVFDSGSAWPWQLRKLERVQGCAGMTAAIEAGEGACLFRWSVREVQAWCPWYYFGGGIKLRRGDVVLRLSFGASAGAGDGTLQGLDTFEQVRDMRRIGALWRDALQASASRARDPSP